MLVFYAGHGGVSISSWAVGSAPFFVPFICGARDDIELSV